MGLHIPLLGKISWNPSLTGAYILNELSWTWANILNLILLIGIGLKRRRGMMITQLFTKPTGSTTRQKDQVVHNQEPKQPKKDQTA